LQRLEMLARLQPDDARLALAPSTARRNGHGKQSRRAKRASNIMPFLGQVFGNQEMLSLPVGQVTTLRSQSIANAALVSPSSRRACQLGSSATGPTIVTP
jgi:hypothetical protein